MGIEFEAKCNDCGAVLSIGCVSVNDFSILLRCERCGGEKFIGDDEIEQAKSRELKKLFMPDRVASLDHNKGVKGDYQRELVSEEEYIREIERIAGTCKCGGKPKFDAPPRCPECTFASVAGPLWSQVFWRNPSISFATSLGASSWL